MKTVEHIAAEEEAVEEKAWLQFGYEQFLRDDSPEDEIYDTLYATLEEQGQVPVTAKKIR